MVSAISRILSFEPPWTALWNWLVRPRRRPRLTRLEDLPGDLLADVGLGSRQPPFDPRADTWRRQGGLGDYLRPGPM
jgi:uncharacterized protein YjiS (DUF1127 family)